MMAHGEWEPCYNEVVDRPSPLGSRVALGGHEQERFLNAVPSKRVWDAPTLWRSLHN